MAKEKLHDVSVNVYGCDGDCDVYVYDADFNRIFKGGFLFYSMFESVCKVANELNFDPYDADIEIAANMFSEDRKHVSLEELESMSFDYEELY